MSVDDYLDQLRSSFWRMDIEEREATLIEVRDYLDQESERLRNLSPEMPKEDALRQAMAEFGAPADIATVFDARGDILSIINQSTGETLLQMPEASGKGSRFLPGGGRGVRVMIKYRGMTVLAVLGLAAVFLVAAMFLGGQDVPVQGEEGVALYSHQGFDLEDFTHSSSGAFYLQEGESAVLRVDLRLSSGCAHVQLVGPTGDVDYDSGDVCGEELLDDVDFTGAGEWTVQITLTDASGDVSVAAYEK